MRVFYRDEHIRITESGIEVDGRRYRLDQLGRIWHQRPRQRGAGRRVLGCTVAVAVGLALLVLGGVALLRADLGEYRLPVLTGAGLLTVACGAAAGFGVDPLLDLVDRAYDRRGSRNEMCAEINGHRVLLYSTPDQATFTKVYRATQRAVEHAFGEPLYGPDRARPYSETQNRR